MSSEALTRGLLLCRVGPYRLAFLASQVTAVEAASADSDYPQARQAFALPVAAGRVLVANRGETVTVDTLEIHSEEIALLPKPPLLRSEAFGSLEGFADARDQLWPVLGLATFSRYLIALRGTTRE